MVYFISKKRKIKKQTRCSTSLLYGYNCFMKINFLFIELVFQNGFVLDYQHYRTNLIQIHKVQ